MTTKTKKAKGPIRFEAIIPVAVISVLGYAYFTWFFDKHMKSAIEYGATLANGAEVNVRSVRTSFIKGSFDLDGLEVTDKDQPTRNLISIDSIHFSYLWDALLRMKFVVEEASINQIQVFSQRKSPGKVIPPKPKNEGSSKFDELQSEVVDQVKSEVSQNVMGDLIGLMEGNDLGDQANQIREQLKSEVRINEMISQVDKKKDQIESDVKRLSDTSKIKDAERLLNEIKSNKNPLAQAQGIASLTKALGDIQKQAKEIQSKSKEVEADVKAFAQYPKEVEALVKEDISSLKDRFKVPQLDIKNLAMALFSKELGSYLLQARKYQALAQQYLPEKSEREVVVPPPRSQGESIEFPITKSYPLFWLKKAAISSKGTSDSYSGDLSGSLTNVTTSPKWVKKPIVLDVNGNFTKEQILGVKAIVTADFTKAESSQRLDLAVNSFPIPARDFSKSDKLTLGITNATSSTSLVAKMGQGQVDMTWNATINRPQWNVAASSKTTEELVRGIVEGIPVIYVKGQARGPWSKLDMDIESNLGSEIASGFQAQVGKKIKEAEGKIQSLIDEKIKAPQQKLMGSLKSGDDLVAQLKNSDKLFKDNEAKIQQEIEKLKKGGQGDVQDKAKKLLKKIRL